MKCETILQSIKKDVLWRDKGKLLVVSLFSLYSAVLLCIQGGARFAGIFAPATENYIHLASALPLLLIIPCFLLIFIAVILLNRLFDAAYQKIDEVRGKAIKVSSPQFFLCCFILFLLCWSPYLLTYYPGCVVADGLSSVSQVLANSYNNHHPLLYTFFVGIFIRAGLLGGSLNLGVFFYSVGQMCLMAAVLAYYMVWLKNKNCHRLFLLLCGIVIALFPLFPYYAITMWKDTLFGLALLLFLLVHADVYLTEGKLLLTKAGILRYALLALGVMFLRNNGIYIVAFSLLCMLFFLWRRNKKTKLFWIVILAVFAVTMVIQGPLYKKLNCTTEFVENLGVPMQQISAVAAYDGEITPKQAKFLENIWDLEELGEKYTPCLADTPKWYIESFNGDYLNAHKGEFFKTWLALCAQNPKIVTEAFLLENLGFWHPTISSDESYIYAGIADNNLGLERTDYFQKFFPFSFENIVLPQHRLSAGFLAWLMLLSLTLSVLQNGVKSFIMPAPVFACWLTILIATPIAFSFRYMYILLLMGPLYLLWPRFCAQNKKEQALQGTESKVK